MRWRYEATTTASPCVANFGSSPRIKNFANMQAKICRREARCEQTQKLKKEEEIKRKTLVGFAESRALECLARLDTGIRGK
jgi:hypothetical protein